MQNVSISKWSRFRTQFLAALSAIGGLVAVGTVVYHALEHWSWTVSFYFSVCTLTTVGYGDYFPTTDASRLFTAIYVLVGVSILFGAIELIGASYLRRGEEFLTKMEEQREKVS